MRPELRVLVVDDAFRVAALHAKIVDTMSGLATVGSARTLSEARALVAREEIDLALVDVYLPDGSGIDLVRELRADAFVLGAADDAASVRAGFAAGALQYLIKPFPATELARRLGAYTAYRRILDTGEVTQEQVDAAAAVLRSERAVPRRDEGASVTERGIVDILRAAAEPMLADEIAAAVGVSPATARRYLAELVRDGTLTMALQYGATGRPRQRYALA
ncbi:response regulator [Nocardiopsis tropica]